MWGKLFILASEYGNCQNLNLQCPCRKSEKPEKSGKPRKYFLFLSYLGKHGKSHGNSVRSYFFGKVNYW